ncbi:MAG TPA: 2OG-Fe(II) oxygenase [Burkholderiaceae bacterium]|nr:2OG-Fe(II) oxygenase [Burkholderiaceae bacterium]
MSYLDFGRLSQISEHASDFLARKPFPWSSLQGVIREEGFARLCEELPRSGLFAPQFGVSRGYGQASHDRFALQYHPRLDSELAPSWRDFISELHSEPYLDFVRKTWGVSPHERIALSMHWHHAPSGASVSPHTDARRKVGSHIFYFNTPQDWDASWGGQTIVLDDGGKLSPHTAPDMSVLREVAASQILGNQSFIFKRTEHSWHAVKPINCPPDHLRKVFIVVINKVNLQVLWRRIRGKDPDGYRL